MNDDIMRAAGFGEQVDRKHAGLCATCGTPIVLADFHDELSRKEYAISGMCQICQTEVFG